MDNYNEVIDELTRMNLCTYYLLPLTGLTKFSFGEGILINCYLDKRKLLIVAQVADLNLVKSSIVDKAIRKWSNDNGGFLVYQINPVWQDDVQRFELGLYSKFSDELKTIIRERSSLAHRQPNERTGKEHTDIRLLALDKDEALSQYWRDQFNADLDPRGELLSCPSEKSYMDVEGV